MAGAAASLGQYLRLPSADRAAALREHRGVRWWLSWEAWLTLVLVILVQLPVVGSLQSSHWVDEMPSLLAPAAIGLTAAWLLGHTRLPGAVSGLLGIALGAAATTALVMHTMLLSDPAASGVRLRWDEFRIRLADWVHALFNEGISTDPLPFVTLLVGCVYLVAFVSTWAVVRWRNPWIALVPGGFVLLTNISYLPGQPSFSFVIFVMAAVMLVARLTFLRSSDGWRREGVAPHESMSLEVLLAGAVVGTVLVFAAWVIPTANHWGPVADVWARAMSPATDRIDQLGQLFIGVGSKKHLPVHAFGASLPLQGEITLQPDVLFEVLADQEGNIRGAVYDDYTGSGWRVSSAGVAELSGTTVDAAGLGTTTSRSMLREPVRVEVTVVGDSAPTAALLSAGDPITTDTAAQMLLDPAGSALALVPEDGAEPGATYTTVGTVSVAAIPTLQEAGTDYPAGVFQRYTALPDDLPPEIASLAHMITADAANAYDAARAVEEYLRQNFAFTYNIDAAPARRDAVAHFLFDERRGYFDQFASAMVVMLRSQGIPARVAAGFALDGSDLDATTKRYLVTEEAAWSWPEVYFPGLGWVEFNPTPSRGVVQRPGDDSEARAAAAFQNNGISTEPELDAFLEAEAMAAPGVSLEELQAMLGDGDGGVREVAGRIIGWLFVVATLVVVVAVAVRVWWERRFRGLSDPEKRWAKLLQFAQFAGLQPSLDRTAVEAADDLGSRIGQGAALREIARAFSVQRYGGALARPEDEERAEHLDEQYRTVRAELRRLIVRRVLRLGRVSGGPLARWHGAAGTAR